MSKIKTQSGFTCEIDENALDDAELLEDLCALDEGAVYRFPSVIRKLLGEENKKRLYEHLRGEDGRVHTSALSTELQDIFSSLNSKKK